MESSTPAVCLSLPLCFLSLHLRRREIGEKVSRGSKWSVLDAGKKYLTIPVHEGKVPEEVGDSAQL